MKSRLLLFLLLAIAFSPGAQVNQKPAGKSKPEESNTLTPQQLRTSLQKLYAAISNPAVPGTAIAGKYLYALPDHHRIYEPAISIQGAAGFEIEKAEMSRNYYDQVSWEYRCLLAKVKGGSENSGLGKLKQVLDSILAGFPACVNYGKDCISKTSVQYSVGNPGADSLAFTIRYSKKTEDNPAALADSILAVYMPGLMQTSTLISASKQFDAALKYEDLYQDPFRPALKPVFVKMMQAVYRQKPANLASLCIEGPIDFELTRQALAEMPADAQDLVKKAAREVAGNYYRRQDSLYIATYYPGSPNPFASGTTPVAGNTHTGGTDICRENQARQQFKAGAHITTGQWGDDVYFITGYDCYSNVYSITRLKFIPARKTFFKSDANVAHCEVLQFAVSAASAHSKYRMGDPRRQLCAACSGTGWISVTQVRTAGGWEQVNFNTKVYSDPRVVATWNEQEACTRCFGQGYITR